SLANVRSASSNSGARGRFLKASVNVLTAVSRHLVQLEARELSARDADRSSSSRWFGVLKRFRQPPDVGVIFLTMHHVQMLGHWCGGTVASSLVPGAKISSVSSE